MCDEFTLNHNIDDTLKKTAIEMRDKIQAHNRYNNLSNIREIDITMDDGDNENENEVFYDSPSYMIPEENGMNNTINLNKNRNPKNLNFKLNPNHNKNPNLNPNPYPNTNSNPMSNNNLKPPP